MVLKKILNKVCALFTIICLIIINFIFFGETPKICKAFYDDITDTSYYYIDEIWDNANKVFYEDKLDLLCSYLTGEPTASARNFEVIEKAAGEILNSKQMSDNSGKEVVIQLGGLDWTPTYLSLSENGDVILTLWLSNTHQDAWQEREADEGEYYGFVSGVLCSDWAANFTSVPVGEVPSNMYGASYIRAVTLNNGGQYATSSNPATYSSCQQDENSVFAKFTMPTAGEDNEIADFIEKPSSMAWQKYQSGFGDADFGSDFPNEAWADDMPSDNFYDETRNYANIVGNSTWANDNLWLPSITEIGYGEDERENGFWNVSLAQRQSHSADRTLGYVGKANGRGNSSIWTRTGHSSFSHAIFVVNNSGDDNSMYSGTVNESYAVRPAMHLNFSKACAKYTYMQAEKIEVTCSKVYISEQTFNQSSIKEVRLYYPDGENFAVNDFTVNVADGEQVNSDDDLVITYTNKKTGQVLTQTLPVLRNFITKNGIIMRSNLGFEEDVRMENKIYTQKSDFKEILGKDYKSIKNIDRIIEINIMQGEEVSQRISLNLSVNTYKFGNYKKFYTYVNGVLQELTPEKNGEIKLDKNCSILIVASTLNVTLLAICISVSAVVVVAIVCAIIIILKRKRKQTKMIKNQQ